MAEEQTTRPRPRPRPTEVEDAAPQAAPETSARRGVAGALRSWWTVVAVLAVAVVAAAGWVVWLHHRAPLRTTQPSVNSKGTYTPGTLADSTDASAVRAAVDYLPAVLSYDYRSLAKGLAAAKKHLTPDFATSFTNTFDDTVEPVAVKNKAVVRTLIRAAALASRSGSSASVLVFVDQALVSADGKTAPKISQDRVHVDLLQSKGQWLIEAVTPF